MRHQLEILQKSSGPKTLFKAAIILLHHIICSGANPIILKRQFRVSSPKFSQILIGKQNHEITASRIQSVFTPETLYSLYFQGFFSPYPEKQNDLIERIFPLYKVVLLLLILFLGLPQIAFAGYSGVRDCSGC